MPGAFSKTIATVLAAVLLVAPLSAALAQGPPPATVVTAKVKAGRIIPDAEFTGTVYYKELSNVAAEVNGLVKEVTYEEGQRVEKGGTLARLDSQLLEKEVAATRANHEQVLTDLEQARLDLKRTRELYDEELASEKAYDDARFRARGLEKQADSLGAGLEALEVELAKKTIRAPFSGVIIEKHVERGEWVDAGTEVATLASSDVVDIYIDVPRGVAAAVTEGAEVTVRGPGVEAEGTVAAVIPRGDIQTRTFPVKVRLRGNTAFMEGMEAFVRLPTGPRVDSLIVPRDALVSKFGTTAVFAVAEGAAKMIPVRVTGYQGATVGVAGEGLAEGMDVVVEGNERLNDGQPVNTGGGPGGAKRDGKPGGN